MFSSKYYNNPFADDEDDLCYGDILSEQGDAPVNAGRSSAEFREKRPATHVGGTSVSRRNGAESSSTEIPLSAVHGADERNSPAHRGQVDAQDYEEYIAELRAELASANAENSRLSAAQTKAETRARSLLFEKENAEWQLQQEKERTRTLAEKVRALEDELEQLASRQSEVNRSGGWTPAHVGSEAAAPHAAAPSQRSHVDPHASSFHSTPQGQSNTRENSAAPEAMPPPQPDRQRSAAARAQFEQRQAAYLESRGGSFERDDRPTAMPPAQSSTEPPFATSGNSGLTRSLRGQRRADAVQEKTLQQQKAAEEQAVAVKRLEELLQTHCQKRDDLARQLQRLESMRLRTVAEKRQKAAVELGLEEEEKTIGHIRLELRSHSALLR